MNWVDKIIEPIRRSRENSRSREIPEGLWQKCTNCDAAIYEKTLSANLGVCPKCEHHHGMDPVQRMRMLFDADNEAVEIGAAIRPRDTLKFTDKLPYRERLKKSASGDPGREALRTYVGNIKGRRAVLACFDFGYMGGSMGSVVGERFLRGIDECCDTGASFIACCASGGARMQEGMLSLMQMVKTTSGQAELGKRGLPFISVLCDPTTGGVAASFALVADVVIAEPGARIGFAGPRVIRETVKQELPEGFQTAEFLLKHGAIDMVVHRSQLRNTIANIINGLRGGTSK